MTATEAPGGSTDALAERLFMAAIHTLEITSVHLGGRLGFYRALAEGGAARHRPTSQRGPVHRNAMCANGSSNRPWPASSTSTILRPTPPRAATPCRTLTTRSSSTRRASPTSPVSRNSWSAFPPPDRRLRGGVPQWRRRPVPPPMAPTRSRASRPPTGRRPQSPRGLVRGRPRDPFPPAGRSAGARGRSRLRDGVVEHRDRAGVSQGDRRGDRRGRRLDPVDAPQRRRRRSGRSGATGHPRRGRGEAPGALRRGHDLRGAARHEPSRRGARERDSLADGGAVLVADERVGGSLYRAGRRDRTVRLRIQRPAAAGREPGGTPRRPAP